MMTTEEVQELIVKEFCERQDWLDKYSLLITLGKNFSMPDKKLRNDENAILGCQSAVWLKVSHKDGYVFFEADSDSIIVKGILALLFRVLNNRSSKEIKETDLYFMEKIGLTRHLSPVRKNGLEVIVDQMKKMSDKN